ncbi:hypothetical protein LG634_34075 [Streptomyces bambusae]|uniref:hypothetical protein n=1 Tax=Streptomyces bambusae TaxID=1550616 RepID=UPI001CFF5CF6|nr:hypothetical protein [Streptomyces bambusae]MCB5169816.1 hypothetical protein [Streptomyces bambusae]
MTTRRTSTAALAATALLAVLPACSAQAESGPQAAPKPVRPVSAAAADRADRADRDAEARAEIERLIDFGDVDFADGDGDGDGDTEDGDEGVDGSSVAGTGDLADGTALVRAGFVPGTYRLSVVCRGGGRVGVTVATKPATTWSEVCDGRLHGRVVEHPADVLELDLTARSGATGPVGYRLDPA